MLTWFKCPWKKLAQGNNFWRDTYMCFGHKFLWKHEVSKQISDNMKNDTKLYLEQQKHY